MQLSKRRKTILSIAMTVLFIWSGSAIAGEAILTWDPNSEPDLAGYKVYVGSAPGVYGAPVDVGNRTSYTVTGLGPGTFYFAVTAYDASGNESAFSNEAVKIFAADTTPPLLSAVRALNIAGGGASVAWSTDEASDSQVQYGTAASYGSSTALDPSMVTAHSQNLTGLLPSTTYHYRVISRDAAGNIAASGDNTFTTLAAPDITPPAISGISAGNITSNGATVTWTTNEPSDTQVEFGTTAAYGSSTSRNSAMGTSHSQGLAGLLPSTTYHFRVLSRDAAGNLGLSGENTFTTAPAPDAAPPAVTAIAASNLTSNTAVITWSTNEPATSQVEYGATTGYGLSSPLDTTLTTSHSRSLSGLSPSTTYHYRVVSKDAAGNTAASGDNFFTTTSAPDTAAPVLSNIAAGNIGADSATLTWTTNEAATSQVEYGTTPAYGALSALNTILVTSHSRTLSGLSPSTTYHYRVSSRDGAGNTALSADRTFITAAASDTTAPVISGVKAENVAADGAVIRWGTDEPATTEIEYGPTAAYGQRTPVNATLSISHAQTLSGLEAKRLYHYRVKSADAAGNLSVSGDQSFTTSEAADTTPPGDVRDFRARGDNQIVQLSWINPSDADFAGVMLRYRTDGSYPQTETDGAPVADFKEPANAPVKFNHAGLQNGVTYYYSAFTYDLHGNYSRTAKAFATPGEVGPADTSTGEGGGCSMALPKKGGSGPAEAAELLLLYGTVIGLWIKKGAAGRLRRFLNRRGEAGAGWGERGGL